ncbi:PAN domain-containing protein At5g03700 [Arachis hypogaea]|nr:PAN domain-containing protein At5g03700 [Arachis hypogaea]
MFRPTHMSPFLLLLFLSLATALTCSASPQIHIGFSASPQSQTALFESLFTDPTGNFSLCFLRRNQNHLALAVIHVASSQPLWLANPTHLASWSHTTRLSFNGTLLLSDPKTNLLWSTETNGGDTLLLLNTSNLQILNKAKATPIWQSFDFPTNTLVQDQNFTTAMSLSSQNGLYSLRLGNDFMGLYANYPENDASSLRQLLYWKRTALEAKAVIKQGQGPIYARVNKEGYLGMYQTSAKPIDVQKFDSFQQNPTASSFLFVRLEPDGNLKGYYWNSNKSSWVLNYQAITETCELPLPCGSYGLCTPGGSGCSCLDNRTRFEPGVGCFGGSNGNLCSEKIGGDSYSVIRRTGVEPPHKELDGHVTTPSSAECEGLCERNCSCWGAMYNNVSGFCYIMDYPIGTMTGSGEDYKVGYFKVRKSESGKNRVGVRVGVVVGVMVGIVFIGAGVWMMRMRWRRKGVNGMLGEENGSSPGPYRNLGSDSFKSIEMSGQR